MIFLARSYAGLINVLEDGDDNGNDDDNGNGDDNGNCDLKDRNDL
jgi:hypothetical protein